MKTRSVIVSVLVLAFLLLNVQFGAGQDPAPVVPQASSAIIRSPGAVPIQGRLTNASGVPLNGTFTIVFSLYDVDTGGTAICSQSHSVIVTNGLFNSYLDGCYYQGPAGPEYVFGQKLWLGVKVGADPEMTPRQVILPVPYALSLSPGAYVRGSETVDEVLTVESTGTSGANPDYDALIAKVKTSSDRTERMKLMHQAEDIIFAESMLCPIYYYVDLYLKSQTLEGFYSSPLGYKYFMYSSVKK